MSARRPNSTMRRCWRRSLRQAGPRVHCSAAEAGRRRLDAAIPVLEDYCRRFAGFGVHRALPEQIAALEALASIGGKAAARQRGSDHRQPLGTGADTGDRRAVAAQLGSHLPAEHRARAAASHRPCGPRRRLSAGAPWTRSQRDPVDLLGDLTVACAWRPHARSGAWAGPRRCRLLRLALRHAPSARVIEAAPPVADDECVVLLGRIASGPDAGLAAAAAAALEVVEHPLATRLLARLRNE